MSIILLNMIHDRALSKKPDVEITAKNYQIWVDHWLKTARDLAYEFDKEGLKATAEAIRGIIQQQLKLNGDVNA